LANFPALDLLNTSKSCDSLWNSAHVDQNLGSGRRVTVTSGNEIRSWKQSEPSSLLVQEYAAALIWVALGVSMGLPEEQGSEYPGHIPQVLGVVPMMEVS